MATRSPQPSQSEPVAQRPTADSLRPTARPFRRSGRFIRLPKAYPDFLTATVLTILGINLMGWLVVPCTFFIATPFLIGYFAAQVGIISIWSALGPRPFSQRAGTWYGIFFVWLTSAAVAPILFMLGSGAGPEEVNQLIGVALMSPMLLLVAQIPFWLVRFFVNWRIVENCDEAEIPFGVADFLWASVLVAVSIGTYQVGIQMIELDAKEIMAVTIRLVPATLLISCLVLVPGTLWILDSKLDRPRIGVFAFWSFLAVFVTTIAIAISFEFGPRVISRFEIMFTILIAIGVWSGFFVTFLIVMYQAYRSGLRIITAGTRHAEIVYVDTAENNQVETKEAVEFDDDRNDADAMQFIDEMNGPN